MILSWLIGCGGLPFGEDGGGAAAVRGGGGGEPETFGGLSVPDDTDPPHIEFEDQIPQGIVGVEQFDTSGTRKVFVRRSVGAWSTELVVAELDDEGWTEEVRISGTPNPDRPAISPDGQTIAFVTGISGMASVWVTPFDGGADPTQITNVGIEGRKRSPGSPPAGFVPPPAAADDLAFDGDWLTWSGPDGPITVRWR